MKNDIEVITGIEKISILTSQRLQSEDRIKEMKKQIVILSKNIINIQKDIDTLISATMKTFSQNRKIGK